MYDCIRCLAETDNDCDICDDCLNESKDNEMYMALRSRIEKLEAEVKRLEQQLKMARRLAYRPQPEYPPEIGVPHLKED